MRKRGVEFLYVPGTYYDTVKDRVGIIEEDMEELKKWGIMVDRDDEGYLLQIFTKPVEDRPTLFLKSFNVKVRNLLEKVISKLYLNQLKLNKQEEEPFNYI